MRNAGPILIDPSETADTRSCDFSGVTKEQLLVSSLKHIDDVRAAMRCFATLLLEAGDLHDQDKISWINSFHRDFKTGFARRDWYERHLLHSRHHLNSDRGQPYDVDLIDVLEYIADCVMAGKARSGQVIPLQIDSELLLKAFENTWRGLERIVTVRPGTDEDSSTE